MPKTPDSSPLPQHKALLAVDVVGSGSNDGRHLKAIPDIVAGLVDTALASRGITNGTKLDDQHTGDGFLRLYPAEHLPTLLDALRALDDEVTEHNTWRKPEVALRVALHIGAVPEERGFHRPNIDLNRLLGAPEFKQVARSCCDTGDKFTTALVISEEAYSAAFNGDLTRVVAPDEFAEVSVHSNEYARKAWIRVTGFAPHQIMEFAAHRPKPEQAEDTEESTADETGARESAQQSTKASVAYRDSIGSSAPVHGTQNTGDRAHIGDNVSIGRQERISISSQTNQGVQAGKVDGDINFGGHQR